MATTKKTGADFRHITPRDMVQLLRQHPDLAAIWKTLTPLARNEWICWVTIVKQKETRLEHLGRMTKDLRAGKKRPCCWPGCPHRRPGAQKWF